MVQDDVKSVDLLLALVRKVRESTIPGIYPRIHRRMLMRTSAPHPRCEMSVWKPGESHTSRKTPV